MNKDAGSKSNVCLRFHDINFNFRITYMDSQRT